MTHDWLLVETLGSEPAVVAKGRRTQNLVPISAFLRRNPHLMAIQTAIAETVYAGQNLTSITPKNDRVIRTEVVQMTDGRIHGVHVWAGPPDVDPPARPVPGPITWDLTTDTVVNTPESLANSGIDPDSGVARLATRDDLLVHELCPTEVTVLPPSIKPELGKGFCGVWDIRDHDGKPITVGFVARAQLEDDEDGTDHVVCRAMNWRSEHDGPVEMVDDLPRRLLKGLAPTGVQRALLDPDTGTLLKWLDDPPQYFDWHSRKPDNIHVDDAFHTARMTVEIGGGSTSGVLRLRAPDGQGWVPVHITLNRVELDAGTFADLATVRPATEAEIEAAGLPPGETTPKPSRRSRHRRRRAARP